MTDILNSTDAGVPSIGFNRPNRMDEEGRSFRRMLGEPAAREAFAAFPEKRQPKLELYR